jgi:hypothetical protein
MMKHLLRKWGLVPLLMALALAIAAPLDAIAQTKEQAARQAAQQYDAKVLSVKEQKQGQNTVYVIKLLTRDGVVKTVRVTKKK